MDLHETNLIDQYVNNNSKNKVIAYLLWLFLGWLGAHRFYLDRVASGILMLALYGIGWLTSPILIGIPLLVVFGIWWLIDAFNVNKWVNESRNKAYVEAVSIMNKENFPQV